MATENVCGFQGDPVCSPPDCGGACPQNKPDLRPQRLPEAPWSSLGIVELRAWARASERMATDEGFPRIAASIQQWIDWFDSLYEAGIHTVTIEPWESDNADR